jgi:pimeloyl-ACP methyl ester carboxylesterase
MRFQEICGPGRIATVTVDELACARAVHRAVSLDDLRLHALESGRIGGPPVCFLHGGSAHAHWFDAVTPAVAGRHHVLALDQRGHGESGWPATPAYATEDFARDLVGVLDALGWERAALVGHSMGGHNAMAFAAWYPERVTALVIVDSRPALPGDRLSRMHARGHRPPRHHPSLAAAVAAFRLLPADTIADPALLAHLAEVGTVRREQGWRLRFDPQCNGSRQPVDAWPLLPRITAPTLIVRGGRSPILPPDMAERMRKSIPRCSLVEIADAYHHLVLDRPAEFAAALRRFLEETLG